MLKYKSDFSDLKPVLEQIQEMERKHKFYKDLDPDANSVFYIGCEVVNLHGKLLFDIENRLNTDAWVIRYLSEITHIRDQYERDKIDPVVAECDLYEIIVKLKDYILEEL